ncbi:MAG: PQQ-dependent sugar dehydrogenase [Pseudomonadales bacterium]
MKKFARVCSALLSAVIVSAGSGVSYALEVQTLASGLNAPWAVEKVPHENTLLVTEKSGRLLRVDMSTKRIEQIALFEQVKVHGQGGLMDVALGPDFSRTGRLFITYAKALGNKSATTLASAVLDRDVTPWRLRQFKELLVASPSSDSGRHFGSRVAFDDAGHVFFSVGDRGERASAQDLNSHNGSVIRLKLDGRVPADNPFVDQTGALPEIYSYGHRNPQGLVFHSERNQLFAMEHGPRGGDELNLITAGTNYGWPVISYGKEYWGPFAVGEKAKAGLAQPMMQYTPSIAPSSLAFYDHPYFESLQGRFLIGALAGQHLSSLHFSALPQRQNPATLAHTQERHLDQFGRRIRDLTLLNDGRIVLLSDRGELLLVSK